MTGEYVIYSGITEPHAFALRATGTRLIEAGIEEGDLVLATPSVLPQTGDIDLVLFRDLEEATITRVEFKEQSRMALLISEHQNRETMLIKTDGDVKFYRVAAVVKLLTSRHAGRRSRTRRRWMVGHLKTIWRMG